MRRAFGRKGSAEQRQPTPTNTTASMNPPPPPLQSPLQQQQYQQQQQQQQQPECVWTAQAIAQLPPPGLSGPTLPIFAPSSSRYLAFVSSASQSTRPVKSPPSLYRPLTLPPASSSTTTTGAPAAASTLSAASMMISNSLFPSSTDSTTTSAASPIANSTGTTTTAASRSTTTTTAIPPTSGATSSSSERMLMCLDLEQLIASRSATSVSDQSLSSSQPSSARPLLKFSIDSNDDNMNINTNTSSNSNASSSNNNNTNQQGRVVKRRFDTEAAATATSTTDTTSSPAGPGNINSNNNNGGHSTGTTTVGAAAANEDLEERLRRERQRISMGMTQFHWSWTRTGPDDISNNNISNKREHLRVLVPARGSLLVQDGVLDQLNPPRPARLIHEQAKSPLDPQLSPDGTMVAWSCDGEVYVKAATALSSTAPIRLSYGANPDAGLSHGIAEFVAQEEMDRYRGFWWHPQSSGILLTRVDESPVPIFRIVHHQQHSHGHHHNQQQQLHHSSTSSATAARDSVEAEDHRYPFAGKANPIVRVGFVPIDKASILQAASFSSTIAAADSSSTAAITVPPNTPSAASNAANDIAAAIWANRVIWFDPPREASEYLCRVYWLENHAADPSTTALLSLWQNRAQSTLVIQRMDLQTQKGRTLLIERTSDHHWVNLHHMFYLLPPIHPNQCSGGEANTGSPIIPSLLTVFPLGSFSFLFASERTGYSHLYLYTYVPGINGEQAVQIRTVSAGPWMVEQILGANMKADYVYFTGTFDSPLERQLYALPITGRAATATMAAQPDTPDAVMTTIHTTSLLAGSCSASSMMSFDEPSTANSNCINNNNSSPSPPNGVRRSLNKVMHALSGGKANASYSNSSSTTVPLRTGNPSLFVRTPYVSANAANNSNTSAALASNNIALFRPIRLTMESGMHSIVMDDECRYFVDTCSDLHRPTSVKIFELDINSNISTCPPKLVLTMFDALRDDSALARLQVTAQTPSKNHTSLDSNSNTVTNTRVAYASLPAPEIITFPTSDGVETLYAALYRPDPRVHGPGPYPLVCAVYGGPHVQRVNRSWSQCADMRAQRLRSLGFCVIKCDNRGSSRRGVAFESAISRRLGRIEVIDQVAAVRQLVVRGIADPSRVGVYGWSYGGYLAAMCLSRAPDVFHVGVAGAPVTSWDGYDTHYTERYMGLPSENAAGYRESSVFEHVPNMRGKLLLVHGLIDENVHFRHTARLINKLIAAGKDYDLLIFPDERHSPRRLRDRVYMEQRISDFFQRHLQPSASGSLNVDLVDVLSQGGIQGLRAMAGRL